MNSAREPFDFVELPRERSHTKPRARGRTMVADFGIPIGAVADLLELAGTYIDLAKIAVGTSRLYPPEYLERKLHLYREHDVRAFIGGQFLEYVFATYGRERLPAFFTEARRLGFEIVEVSDNCVPLDDRERRQQIELARSHGLSVFGEVGSKDTKNDPAALVRQAQVCLHAGAELVLVEAAEFVDGGSMNAQLLSHLRDHLDLSRVLIELPGPWISGTSLSLIEDMKKALIAELGPDVNIANAMPHDVIELEALRVGLGVVGPTVAARP